MNLTPVSRPEVLPAFRKTDVDRVEGKALRFYTHAERNAAMFAVELRRLQDGGAHLIRGYPNFGVYVERTFEGISATNAAVISRQGMVLLILDDRGRINLEDKNTELPGTTGIRILSTLHKQFGEDTMVAIYNRAKASGRKITDEVVKAAAKELVQIQPQELGEGSEEPPEESPEDDDDGYSEVNSELLDVLDQMRDLLSDIGLNINNPDSMSYLKELESQINEFRTKLKNANECE